MSHPQFCVERVLSRSVVSRVDHPASENDHSGAVDHSSVCLLRHSVMDELQKFLDHQGSDLHKYLNLTMVLPTWNVTHGLTLHDLGWVFGHYVNDTHLDVVVIQLAGNDVDSLSPVVSVTDEYILLAGHYVNGPYPMRAKECGSLKVDIFRFLYPIIIADITFVYKKCKNQHIVFCKI